MTLDLTAANTLPARSDELFRIYSRFEFALKMARYCKLNGKAVEVEWDRFANNRMIGQDFFNHIRKANICPTLTLDPPKLETITNGLWGFAGQAKKPRCSQDLFGLIRRVRNNLFHGGKYFGDNTERDALLVSEAISVLLLAAEWDNEINFFFEGRA
jgi:hypothetical protein